MRPPSFMRLLRHGLHELPRDVNGVPGGEAYEEFLKVRDMRSVASVRPNEPTVYLGRHVSLGSLGEYKVFCGLEANARVLDIREGYPRFSHRVLKDLLAGDKVARNRVSTFDFVVTLAPRVRGGPLRYLALPHKPQGSSLLYTPRMVARDSAYCRQVGWELSTVSVPTTVQYENFERLRDWAMAHPLDDGAQDAKAMAGLLNRSVSNRPMWSVLASCAKKLGIADGDEYFVFACAFYLGYINLDTTLELHEELPLALAPAR